MQSPKFINTKRIAFVVLAVLLLAVISWIAPAKLVTIGYKLCLVSLASIVGYFIDYLLFPKYRCGELDDEYEKTQDPHIEKLQAIAVYKRAIIIVGCILGLTLAL